jgi:hypothetical protein
MAHAAGRPRRPSLHFNLLNRLPKSSILSLILGGAAVHRSDHRLAFSPGFSR